jgi:uncharacterized protein (TIGR02246 family)
VFERYTEKARRSIFFARYEATQYGSCDIEAEHLLLGILREDSTLSSLTHRQGAGIDDIRRKIEERIPKMGRNKISTGVELPLSTECRRILKNTAQVADRLGDRHIGTEHLFLALLAEVGSWAATILRNSGIKAGEVRQQLAGGKQLVSDRKIQAALEEFVGAWIERDLETFVDFFQHEALLIDLRGSLHEGREAIAEYCAERRGDARNLNTRKVTPSEPRLIRQGVAVVPVDWEFTAGGPGDAPRLVRSLLLMREQSGEWRIAAAQLTEVRPPDSQPGEPGKASES